MKHKQKSASPCQLACPLDAPPRQAKPKSKSNHERSVPSFGHPSGAATCPAIDFCSRMKNVEFHSQLLDFTLFLSFSPRRIRASIREANVSRCASQSRRAWETHPKSPL